MRLTDMKTLRYVLLTATLIACGAIVVLKIIRLVSRLDFGSDPKDFYLLLFLSGGSSYALLCCSLPLLIQLSYQKARWPILPFAIIVWVLGYCLALWGIVGLIFALATDVTRVGMMLISTAITLSIIVLTWQLERYLIRRKKSLRFENRSTVSLDNIYSTYFNNSQLDQDVVKNLWTEVAKTLHVSVGKLRPSDRFDKELRRAYWFDTDNAKLHDRRQQRFESTVLHLSKQDSRPTQKQHLESLILHLSDCGVRGIHTIREYVEMFAGCTKDPQTSVQSKK